jgi:predicted membrane-bound mannosyltransferase
MAYYARTRIRGDAVGWGARGALAAYLVYWALAAAFIYSWAGEKMPWMMVHIAQPLILLAGRTFDDLVQGVEWRRAWQTGGVALLLILPLLIVSVAWVVRWTASGRVFQEADDTLRWLLALGAGSGLLALAWRQWGRLGERAAWRVVLVFLSLVGGLLTVRYSWLANYINYDTAREFLVYSHGTPDLKHTVRELEALSRRLHGDPSEIRFAYTDDVTWPIECYLEPRFPNRVFIGTEPSRSNTNELVLLVGAKEIEATEPFLGDRYHRSNRRYLWFPHQDYYMNLSLAVPREEDRDPTVNYFLLDMQDPVKRRAFLDVVFYRRYQQSLADWEPANPGKFALYVRKDVPMRIWDYEVGPAGEQ